MYISQILQHIRRFVPNLSRVAAPLTKVSWIEPAEVLLVVKPWRKTSSGALERLITKHTSPGPTPGDRLLYRRHLCIRWTDRLRSATRITRPARKTNRVLGKDAEWQGNGSGSYTKLVTCSRMDNTAAMALSKMKSVHSSNKQRNLEVAVNYVLCILKTCTMATTIVGIWNRYIPSCRH